MGGGGADQPPYDAALRLTIWALVNLPYLEGRLLLAGIDPRTLTAGQWLSVAYAMLADSIDGFVDRGKVIDNLNESLAEPVFPDADTFGTDPRSVRATRAMMDMAGGPAPARTRERPAAWAAREEPPEP